MKHGALREAVSSEAAQRSQSLRRAGLTILKDRLPDPDKPAREMSPFCFAPSPFQVPQLPDTIQAENWAASWPSGGGGAPGGSELWPGAVSCTSSLVSQCRGAPATGT